jgi:Uma2 family endonuclease
VEPATGKRRLSFAEYIAIEERSEVRHEYLDGEIYAMSGGSIAHAELAMRIGAELSRQLGDRCRVFGSDLRIRVQETGLATYPDVTVVCGPPERDPEHRHTVVNPIVLVEVLSASTERYDRDEKLAHYRRIASLQAYLLVSQEEPRIEVLRRNQDGTWTLSEARPPGAVAIEAIGCRLDVADVYRGVELGA